MSTRNYTGIVPPVCTPFTEDYEIDVPSLERLIAYLLDAGVHGIFALGSTSETALLSDAQRQTVIEVIVRSVGGAVPVIAGIIDLSTASSLDHARAAQRLGVDGLVLTCPFYVRASAGEILEHFRMIKAAVDLPIVAYDIPFAVQSKLPRAVVVELAAEGTIAGIKDSSGDDANFRQLVMETNELPHFARLTGSELLVDTALLYGADGCVPGLGNVDPAGYVNLYDLVRAGQLEAARAEQERLIQLFAIVNAATHGRMGYTAAALGGFKSALMLRGVIRTNVLGRPLTRYNDEEVARVRCILAGAGLV
ncbi:MAG: dihydrodipicolinate synthase family protein [Chloroflexota bacterium]|nr:dihydrodipicolinate synthase family protein [Chloroflexota bacterium]